MNDLIKWKDEIVIGQYSDNKYFVRSSMYPELIIINESLDIAFNNYVKFILKKG